MKKKQFFTKRLITNFFLVLLSAGILNAANYYVDPATGSMGNNGSESSPWSTLAAVFSTGKTFASGDIIYLKSGNHGFPNINQSNPGDVTITKYPGHNPIINRIDFNGASHWIIDNVRVYTTAAPPEPPVLVHPVPAKINNSLIRVMNGTTHITFTNCFIYSIEDPSSWTGDDWNWKAWNGMYVNSGCHYITIENCHVKNVNFGIHLNENSEHNILRYTTIENFCGDGLRISEYGIFEYNVIIDAIASNPGQHYDLIQGFRIANGVVIRGNILISQTSDRSFSGACQGIGLFDGMFDDLIIENNLIACSNWHGLSLYGARNCRIVNNTLVRTPYGSGNTPWIAVYNHKDGTASSGNVVRNNLASNITSLAGTSASNNIETTAYTTHFLNYSGLDFRLKSSSSAVNGGTSSLAPTIDLNQYPRSGNPDIGCYELGSVATGGDTEDPSMPTGLAVGTVTFSTVALSWNASTDNVGITGYKVYVNGSNPVSVGGTSTTIQGLSASTTYTFTVSAYDAAGNESAQSSSVQATTEAPDTQAPSVPTSLTAGTVTTNSVGVSWNASTDNVGVTGYKVYTNGANPVSIASTSATISGLTDNTTYTFTVSAIDAASNESAQSSAVQVTTDAITSVTSNSTWQSFTESTQTGSFTATFDITPNGSAIDGVTGILNGTASVYDDVACIVRFNTSGQIDARNGGSYTSTNTVNYSSGTSYHFRLEINVPSHTYSVYVTPQGQSEITLASNFAFRTAQQSVTQLTGWALYAYVPSHTVDNMTFSTGGPDTQAPSVPTELTTGTITASSVALSWNASTDNVGVTGYKVYTNGSNPQSVTGTSATISGLNDATSYTFTVSAVDAESNESAQSGGVNATTLDATAPSIPTGLATGAITTSSVALSWNASTDNVGVTGYKVYINGANPQSVAGTSATISGLNDATSYTFTVSAVDAASNESAQSGGVNATTLDGTAPSVPTGLASSAITTSSVDLSWNASTDNVGVTGYKVYTNGSNPQSVAGTSATISGLSASTQYSFSISAIDAASNESAQSSAIQVTTATPPDTEVPSVPTGLVSSNITTTSFTLSWNASTDNVGVTGYDVYKDGALETSVTGTSANITGLSAATTYSMTVKAKDAADNVSAASSALNVTTSSSTPVTSGGTWQSFPISTQTGTFTATFDAVPNGSAIDGVTGILNGTASVYNDLACIVRFNTSGQIDARNGGSYTSTNTVNYSSGTSYHFRLEINISSHTYSVYVTPQGQSEVTLASNFAFRTQQQSVTQLTGWALYAYVPSHTVSNMTFTSASNADINLTETIEPSVKVYPNPLNGNTLHIQVNGYNADKVNINIYDLTGRSVYNQLHAGSQSGIQIPANKLNKGIYVISINGTGIQLQQKLVVE